MKRVEFRIQSASQQEWELFEVEMGKGGGMGTFLGDIYYDREIKSLVFSPGSSPLSFALLEEICGFMKNKASLFTPGS